MRASEPVFLSDEERTAKLQNSFDNQIQRLGRGEGVTTDTGLSSLTEGCLFRYAIERTPENLAKAQLALKLDIIGVSLDG